MLYAQSWKERWFTLRKMQLSYYRTRTDSTPLRAINLSECMECCAIDSFQGHDNCFRSENLQSYSLELAIFNAKLMMLIIVK